VRKLFVAITAQFPVAVRPSFGRRLLRAFMRVGIGIAILYLLGFLFGPPLMILYTIRQYTNSFPELKLTPHPLTDYSVSDIPGKRVSYFGYEFTVPWNSNFKEKGAIGIMGLKFESGQNLILFVSPNADGLLTEVSKDPSMHMEALRDIFPELIKRSAYDQIATLYGTTPSSIHAFGSRADTYRGMTLLTMKMMVAPASLPTGVFSFDFSGKRGFQIGDPRKSNRVVLDICDVEGHNIEIVLSTQDNNRLTQSEVNRIISSLQTVPSQPTETSATHKTASHK
jgi:hypothetical protein